MKTGSPFTVKDHGKLNSTGEKVRETVTVQKLWPTDVTVKRNETVEKSGNRHCEERSDVAILLFVSDRGAAALVERLPSSLRELAMTAK